MGQIFTVYVEGRPRSALNKLRRRLRGQQLTRAKCARKYLAMALAFDERYKANHANVPVEKLIFGGDTKATNAIIKALAVLDDALGSHVTFVPAQ